MLTSLILSGILGVLLIPVQSQLISVCLEEDEDLRVDCRIEPKPNKISSYEFSWSSGTKEALINTNVSGSAAEAQFRDKSEVVELDPHGYRMTLKGFTNTLPHNTTYMCKISGQVESIKVEKEHLQPCSAVSLFLKSSWSWIVPLLIVLFHTHC
ncbi:thy-1 membrane glycoprotein-like [Xiphophorus maculatus]|uniref:Thy-1 membrane glycoprotein-like n=1 Tax=Xiphophorus maculatus TaxID=8083 RepID=M4A8Z1_XIPMA|nr:thy-1 membrane glycoprotein-like [Xiphophorus maculatus]